MNTLLKESRLQFLFHKQLLKDEKFLEGDFTTKFMDDFELE
jgi:biotin carboxylase